MYKKKKKNSFQWTVACAEISNWDGICISVKMVVTHSFPNQNIYLPSHNNKCIKTGHIIWDNN